jgi:hypothetical protein
MDKYEFAELVFKTEDIVNSFKNENILFGDVIFFVSINDFRFGIKENNENEEKVLIIDRVNDKVLVKFLMTRLVNLNFTIMVLIVHIELL